MTAEEFIAKWRYKVNSDGSPTVGIHVDWDSVPIHSRIIQLEGQKAWEKMYKFSPPWDFEAGVRKPFKDWVTSNNLNYLQLIREELANGKIKYYKDCGLEYPYFPVFADSSGAKGIVGDGNHRFVDCDYLIRNGVDLGKDIERCKLDILCLDNLPKVIQDATVPNY